MKTKLLNEGSFINSKSWNMESTLHAGSYNSDRDMIMENKQKKRNKENLADRFIPSKISSDAYNLFVT